MTKIISLICIIAAIVFITNGAKAQVNVTPNSVNYTTLKAAFNAINAGTHTGAITISISGNTTETDSCVINASGTGSASYSSITMSPTGGAARTIQGNINGNFIVFNGADNFTINGLNTGGNSLIISNSSATTLATTLRFFGDASNNTITNTSIKGSCTSNSLGVIQFQRGTTIGNKNNTISNCDIGPAGSNLPFCVVYSAGASTIVPNDNITITGCNIFDYFAAATNSFGIQLTGFANASWTITNNKFYQTGARTSTASITHQTISISGGGGYVVSGNTIGYSSNSATGVYQIGISGTAFAVTYVGISGNFIFSIAPSRISNNTFRNILLYTTSGTNTGTGIWCAINAISGEASIDSNTIGDVTSNNSITVISSTNLGTVIPISSTQSNIGDIFIRGNTIGSITCKGSTAAIGTGFTGINVSTSNSYSNLTLANNLIGSNTQANSIYSSDTLAAPTGGRTMIGIIVASGWFGNVRIANNTVRNMTSGSSAFRYTGATSVTTGITCASIGGSSGAVTIDSNTVRDINVYQSLTTTSTSTTTGIVSSGSVVSQPLNIRRNIVRDITTSSASTSVTLLGISITGASVAYNCSDNTIFNLNCAHSTAANAIKAINTSSNGAGTNVITRNLIYNTTIASSSVTAQHTGIYLGNASPLGITTISNNMISLGSAVTANQIIYGIDEENALSVFFNIWFNSVYIGGAATSNTARTACLVKGGGSTTMNVESNIFYNARTFTGAGNLGYGMITTITSNLTSNYNNVYTPGANGCTARNTSPGTDYTTLTAWRTANPTLDFFSFSTNPLFVNPSASTPDLHLQDPNPQSRAGGTNASVLVDFDGNTRPSTAGQRPDIGADESNFSITPNNIDYQAPVITINSTLPLTNNAVTGSRTLTGFAKIVDNGTLGSGAKAPRIYYRRIGIDPDNFTACFSGGNNSGGAAGWRYTTATGNTGDDYDFSMDFTLFNGGSVSSGNQIGWFVAAQDISTVTAVENLSTNQAGGIATVSPPINNLTTPFGTSTANYLFNITSSLSGVVTVGAGGTYPNLTGASGLFNAINTTAVTGNIYVSVRSNLVEPGTVGLNAFETPYTIQIRPSGSLTTRLIEGTNIAGGQMIDLAGADRVNFNGADSATNTGQYFRFVNNNATPANTGPVFRFINDARQDSVRNCIIESNSSNSPLVFLATTVNSSGNDSISVDNCLFKQSAGTNPGRYFQAYTSTGTGSGAQRNSDNSITNCNFTGMLGTATSDVSIINTGNGDNWTISNNKFYNDIVFTVSHTVILVNNTLTNNVTVSGNSIGGSAPNRSGTYLGTSGNFSMTGISLIVGNTIPSNIQGNTIANFGTVTATSNALAIGINVSNGAINIGTTSGNIIGGLANPWDTCIAGYTGDWIYDNGINDTVRIENNTIGNCAYYNAGGSGTRNSGITAAGGLNIIRNNTIRDLKGNMRGVGAYTDGTKGIAMNTSSTGQIIEGNTFYNLLNNNTTAINAFTTGIAFSGTGTGTISRNRIYNITGLSPGTGGNTAQNIGIYNESSGLINIINNQISLSASTLEQTFYGIYTAGLSGTNILYNSVYIGGVCAGTSLISSCYIRASTTTDILRNNLFFIQRTGGASNYCVYSNNTITWTPGLFNYNAYFPTAANQVGAFGSLTLLTFANWKINALCDANSVSTTGVSSANLFTSTATGNLNIIPTNTECGYVNGLGTPVTSPQVLSDYGTSSTVRSVTIAGGATDIGSDEFTPIAAPPSVISSGPPAPGTTTTYTFMGRTIGHIDWGAGGTVPTGLEIKYYSGTNPPGSIGFPVANGYWLITALGGSGFSYDITLNFDDAIVGNIGNKEDIRLSKSEDGGGTWNTFTVSGTASEQYELDTINNTVKVYGLTSFSTFTLSSANAPLPVELSSFTSYIDRRNVMLKWTTVTEHNNAGFDIERKESGSENGWRKVGNVAGSGTSSTAKNYSFTENNLNTGKYNYRLKQIDFNGNFRYHILAEEVEIGIPNKYEISQNYPNPFNPSTKINYDLPFDSKVQIKIFDMTGREVYQLVNQTQKAGYYTSQFNASALASGVYFYQIVANGGKQTFTKTMKMVLVK